MFLHLLDRAQRREFSRTALFLVRADGVVDLREEDALSRANSEIGFVDPDDLPAAPRDLDDLLLGLEAFDTSESRRVLVLELLTLTLADGEAGDPELEVIAAICRRLDVSRDDHRALHDFARRLLDLRADGLELLGGA